MSEFKFEITEHLGTLSESAKGWTKELNKVSFNDRPAKYDLREWDPDHQKMSKGVTLNDEEMEILSKILKDRGI
ncbi:MAG: YdbC family protein [Peptoniphilus sp.]|uniref:YdbC family protein n=1 Tax=Peptoniphilus TaxID=162289 RepID=UPI00254DD5F4|nr:YdbC family protein [Peptoniphilus harei]MDK7377837.1 YdbC family protein [Peptoniphilus harei]MDK7680148.1 YdbC family protein [Peptoniphilus harei]MDU5183886.1 YdbC family protein [Peptoniphilus harei]